MSLRKTHLQLDWKNLPYQKAFGWDLMSVNTVESKAFVCVCLFLSPISIIDSRGSKALSIYWFWDYRSWVSLHVHLSKAISKRHRYVHIRYDGMNDDRKNDSRHIWLTFRGTVKIFYDSFIVCFEQNNIGSFQKNFCTVDEKFKTIEFEFEKSSEIYLWHNKVSTSFNQGSWSSFDNPFISVEV